MGAARIPPLPPSDRSDDEVELLAKVGAARDLNLFTTLIRYPRLFRRWIPLCGGLLTGALPARDRELLILRTAFHCGARYEWAHHQVLGAEAGLSSEEIDRVRRGPSAPGWSEFDAVLLTAADELRSLSTLTDPTWEQLNRRYTTEQMFEVPFVVGQYHLVAFFVNSLRVEVDHDFSQHDHLHQPLTDDSSHP